MIDSKEKDSVSWKRAVSGHVHVRDERRLWRVMDRPQQCMAQPGARRPPLLRRPEAEPLPCMMLRPLLPATE